MVKKGLFFLVFAVLAFSVSGGGLREVPYDKKVDNGALVITKYTGLRKGSINRRGVHRPVKIPDTFTVPKALKIPSNRLPVSLIGEDAFAFKKLISITLPNRVTQIGDWSFSNNNLISVSIPSTVTTIKEGAFAFNQLEAITIPGNASIEKMAFYNNKIVRIITSGGGGNAASSNPARPAAGNAAGSNAARPAAGNAPRNANPIGTAAPIAGRGSTGGSASSASSSLIIIGAYAFADNQLDEVTIGNYVESVGDWAFFNNNLTRVSIGNKVESIGEGAFSGNQLLSVTIPDSVTSIGDYAFASNTQLKEVTIGQGVSHIGDWAFDYDFTTDYYRNRRRAGTYTYDGKGSWTFAAK
jgi:hypothetical protein